MSSPVIEWRSATAPYPVVTSVALVGTGYNGAVPMGTTSSVVTLRLYNNFAGSSNVTDAQTCVFAVYDDAINQGNATTSPVKNKYVSVQVVDYNGVTTGADTQYYPLGGITKHPLPTNGGTIGGLTPNYVTIMVKVVIPTNATQGSIVQGLWLEYNTTS